MTEVLIIILSALMATGGIFGIAYGTAKIADGKKKVRCSECSGIIEPGETFCTWCRPQINCARCGWPDLCEDEATAFEDKHVCRMCHSQLMQERISDEEFEEYRRKIIHSITE